MLSSQHAIDKQEIEIIFESVSEYSVLSEARNIIAMHGDPDESDSNFMQLLMLRGIDDPMIMQTVETKKDKYMSPQKQNEILSILTLQILISVIPSDLH